MTPEIFVGMIAASWLATMQRYYNVSDDIKERDEEIKRLKDALDKCKCTKDKTEIKK